ncbi:MAG: hypothetical protein GY794_26230, partial [bacterium]|nr:hypothetical protein [bacterium]
RLTTRQDLKKVQPTVKSQDPVHVEKVMERLPALKPGEFELISPDNFDGTRPMRTRWLYSSHETLDEERIEQLADARWRERFPMPTLRPEIQEPRPADEPEAPPLPKDSEASRTEPKARDMGTGADPKLLQQAATLAAAPSMDVVEFARRASVSNSTARGILGRLRQAELADRFKEGRGHRYWAKSTGLRPDLGLSDKVMAIRPLIPREEAERIGDEQRERKLLGVIGDDEELVGVELEYRPLFRVRFREKVRRSFWRRIISRGEYEHRAENVYLHPRNMHLVVYNPKDGISLHERPEELASEVEDFDGVVRFERMLPGELPMDEHEWRERQSDEVVIERFHALYQTRPQSVEPVFLPLWRLHLRVPGRPGVRILTIDALSGFHLDW